MKKFILSIAIVLGTTLFLDSGLSSGLSSGLGTGLNSEYGWGAGLGSDKPGVNMIYRNGEYLGYSLRLRGSTSVFTPAGKESEPWIICTHTSSTVVCN